MRNLKKILALALALVMTLSVMTVANAAFTDSKDINADYNEAVEVLSGLGVFKGTGTGSTFSPKQSITRAEVAAIIYRIATGDVKDTQVGIYADYAKFKDVKSTAWYAGYVGYCANAELIKGDGKGNFLPTATVTGYQALAMILRAVGYDVNGEFTGSGWQVKVASTAKELGITDTVNAGTLGTAAARETVAELLFRTLIFAPIVKYTTAFGYQPVTTIAAIDLVNGTVSTRVTAQTLGLKTFGLKQTVRQNLDEWGRPGYYWYANKTANTMTASNVVATIAETPIATYQAATKECNIASNLKFNGNKENQVTTYVNGAVNKTITYVNAVDTVTNVGAQGRLTEVYADRIVMIDTYLAQVTNVTAARFDTAGHLITQASMTLTVYDAATNSASSNVVTKGYVLNGGKDNFTYNVGDMVLINAVTVNATSSKVATAQTKYAEVIGTANSITGAQTTIWYNTNQHTVAGTTYNDANTFYLDEAQKNTTDHTWYFDSYGNLIGSAIIKTAKAYAVISNIWWYNDGQNGGAGSCYATMVGMDGNSYSAQIASIDGYTTTYVGSNTGNGATINQAGYRYTSADGKTKLIFVSPYSANNAAAGMIANDLYEVTTLANGKLALKVTSKLTGATVEGKLSYITGTLGSTSTTILTNSATQYLVFNGKTFVAYTGFNTINNYKGVPVSYVANTATGYAAYVYIVGNPASQPSGKLVYVQNAGYNYDPTTQVYTVLNVTVDGVAAQSIQTKDVTLVNLLVQATDKLFYVDFTGDLAVMTNNSGMLTTHEITTTEVLSEIDANLEVTYLAGAYLTADGLSKTNPATQPVYNVTGVTPVVGDFSGDLSTKGIYLTYKKVGTLNLVQSAYVTEAKVANLTFLANSNVDKVGFSNAGVVISTEAVATQTYAVGSKITLTAHHNSNTFGKDVTFTLTLSNGRVLTAKGNDTNTMTFTYDVLASDVLSYAQTISVVSISK